MPATPPDRPSAPLPFALAPEDRERSPYTGFARAHWEAVADGLLEGLRPFATPGHARIHPPGGRPSVHGAASDGLEGFARSFLLAAFRLAGAKGRAPGALAERYAEGLVAGTDPGHPEAWPRPAPRAQTLVEAAAVAIGLYETRPWIWEALPERARTRAAEWLAEALRQPHWPNNWLLFPVMVDAFLRSVGAPGNPAVTERSLALVESWYRRDGWYTDGPGQNYDHYVGWALHLYTLWWCRMEGRRREPERARRFERRAARYLEDARHLFAADGAPLHQGRSLLYRFAAAAPLFAGALLDATPLPPGETRRAASGCLRHFLERGALREGVLSMGWYGECLDACQPYSGPASPYWASKAFLGLLLPPEHPVWQEREEPLPVERGDFCRALPEPGFSVRGTRADGIVRVASHKSDHHPVAPSGGADDPHYRKLVYSTHTAPGVGAEADAEDLDAQVALVSPDGSLSRRARIHAIAVADRFAASCFFPGEPVVAEGRAFPVWLERVETVSIAWGPCEIRVHHAATPGERRLRDGACAVADAAPPEGRVRGVRARVRRRDGLASWAAGLHGFGEARVAEREGASAIARYDAVPYLLAAEPVGAEGVYVALHGLARGAAADAALEAPLPDVAVAGRRVRIDCPDGERFFVQCGAVEPVEEALGPLRLRGRVRLARASPEGSAFVLRAEG